MEAMWEIVKVLIVTVLSSGTLIALRRWDLGRKILGMKSRDIEREADRADREHDKKERDDELERVRADRDEFKKELMDRVNRSDAAKLTLERKFNELKDKHQGALAKIARLEERELHLEAMIEELRDTVKELREKIMAQEKTCEERKCHEEEESSDGPDSSGR